MPAKPCPYTAKPLPMRGALVATPTASFPAGARARARRSDRSTWETWPLALTVTSTQLKTAVAPVPPVPEAPAGASVPHPATSAATAVPTAIAALPVRTVASERWAEEFPKVQYRPLSAVLSTLWATFLGWRRVDLQVPSGPRLAPGARARGDGGRGSA